MVDEDSKALIRHFFEEVWDQGNLAAAVDLIAPEFAADFVGHGFIAPRVQGPEYVKLGVSLYHSAFSDIHTVIEDLKVEGAKVVARVTTRAVHQGEYKGVAASGAPVLWQGSVISRIADRKITAMTWIERRPQDQTVPLRKEAHAYLSGVGRRLRQMRSNRTPRS